MYFLRNKQLSFVFMLYSQKKFIFNSPGSVIVSRIKDITRLFVCITLWAVLSQMKCLWWFQLNYPNHFAVYYLNSLRIIVETDLSATRGIGGWVDVVKQFTGDHSYLCGHPLAALPCDAFTVNLLVTNLLKFYFNNRELLRYLAPLVGCVAFCGRVTQATGIYIYNLQLSWGKR